MEQLEICLAKKMNNISKQQRCLFISVFVSGFLAHGYMFMNNITYHDGILSINSFGATFNLGRFVLGLIEIAERYTVGVYAAPLFQGMLSLFFIALSGIVILDILHIRRALSAIYTGIILAVFPVVTSIFAYMYTSGAYWCALFLNVLAVQIVVRKQKIMNVIMGATLLIVGLGIYQAYFTVAVTLFFLSLMVDLLEDMTIKTQNIVVRGIWYLLTMGIGLVGYLVVNKIVVIIGNVGLSSYKGMNEVGKIQISKIPILVKDVYYYMFVEMNWCGVNGTLFQRTVVMFIILLTLLLVALFLLKSSGAIGNKILLIVMVLVLPLALNSIYLMSTNDNYSVHTLMRYSLVFTFIIPIILLEHVEQFKIWKEKEQLCKNGIVICLSLLMWILPATYVYVDNASYMKMDFLKEQAVAWFTELVSEIKGTEGYRDELPVVYIGERAIEDVGLAEMSHFGMISADGYGYDLEGLVNNYAWRAFVERHCGYAPEEIWEREKYENMDEVIQMPAYPDKGSIKVIDDVVVIKFSK